MTGLENHVPGCFLQPIQADLAKRAARCQEAPLHYAAFEGALCGGKLSSIPNVPYIGTLGTHPGIVMAFRGATLPPPVCPSPPRPGGRCTNRSDVQQAGFQRL